MYNAGEMMQLTALRNAYPKDNITLLSLYSIIDPQKCKKLNIQYVGNTKPGSKLKIIINTIALTLKAIAVRTGFISPKGMLKAINDSDVVIDLGGDTFSDEVSPIYTLVHSLSLLPAIALGKKYVLLSQSIGEFKTPVTRLIAKFILNHATLILSREYYTTQYLIEQLKIPAYRIIELPDIAYTCETLKQSKPKTKAIGILTASLYKKQTGITYDDNIKLLVRIAEYYQYRGYKIILIPHLNCNIKGVGAAKILNDKYVAQQISDRIPYCKIVEADDIGEASLIIGSRMHACVKALINDIPVVALSYQHKFLTLNGTSKLVNIQEANKDFSKVTEACNEILGVEN